jgi:hypothetical protein
VPESAPPTDPRRNCLKSQYGLGDLVLANDTIELTIIHPCFPSGA